MIVFNQLLNAATEANCTVTRIKIFISIVLFSLPKLLCKVLATVFLGHVHHHAAGIRTTFSQLNMISHLTDINSQTPSERKQNRRLPAT